MCGRELLLDGDEYSFRWVSLGKFEAGTAQMIHVPVCGECYPRLATTEGIDELTRKVNE